MSHLLHSIFCYFKYAHLRYSCVQIGLQTENPANKAGSIGASIEMSTQLNVTLGHSLPMARTASDISFQEQKQHKLEDDTPASTWMTLPPYN